MYKLKTVDLVTMISDVFDRKTVERIEDLGNGKPCPINFYIDFMTSDSLNVVCTYADGTQEKYRFECSEIEDDSEFSTYPPNELFYETFRMPKEPKH